MYSMLVGLKVHSVSCYIMEFGGTCASFPELIHMADAKLSSYSISVSRIDGINTQAQVFQLQCTDFSHHLPFHSLSLGNELVTLVVSSLPPESSVLRARFVIVIPPIQRTLHSMEHNH